MENKTKSQIVSNCCRSLAIGSSSFQTTEQSKEELEKEVEQHMDDIEHLELLREQYEERERAYEVGFCRRLPSR
jgi:Tfp pilus assembly protein PilO